MQIVRSCWPAMNPYHEKVLREIERATAGMTEEQLSARREGKWSVAEILEHLALAFGHTATMLKRCIDAGKPLGNKPSLKHRLISGIVVDLGYFPAGRQAPKMVIPSGSLTGQEAVAKIRANLLE